MSTRHPCVIKVTIQAPFLRARPITGWKELEASVAGFFFLDILLARPGAGAQ